jgi:hypothetical protein
MCCPLASKTRHWLTAASPLLNSQMPVTWRLGICAPPALNNGKLTFVVCRIASFTPVRPWCQKMRTGTAGALLQSAAARAGRMRAQASHTLPPCPTPQGQDILPPAVQERFQEITLKQAMQFRGYAFPLDGHEREHGSAVRLWGSAGLWPLGLGPAVWERTPCRALGTRLLTPAPPPRPPPCARAAWRWRSPRRWTRCASATPPRCCTCERGLGGGCQGCAGQQCQMLGQRVPPHSPAR